jgi:hypothetical protein
MVDRYVVNNKPSFLDSSFYFKINSARLRDSESRAYKGSDTPPTIIQYKRTFLNKNK